MKSNNVQLHNHTYCSLNDGAIPLSYYDEKQHKSYLVDRLNEIGCTAFATTEHGNMMSDKIVSELLEGSGIKHIHGVEAYVERGSKRDHLVLLAEDYTGYRSIMKAVTASNDNRNDKGFPMMTDALLKEYFGEGSEGHGHVIATSACMQGVISSQLLHNYYLEKSAVKEELKAEKSGFDEFEYAMLEEEIAEKEEELENIKEQRTFLNKLKNKTFTKKIKELQKLVNEPGYEEMKASLDREQEETRLAADEYLKVKESEQAKSKVLTELKKQMKKLDVKYDKVQSYYNAAKEYRGQKISESEMYENAVSKVYDMIEIFGKDNFYLELQYHGIDAEEIVFPEIVNISYETGCPLCATNDAHMLTSSDADMTRRQILRSLRFNEYEEIMQGDSELYLKTNEELEEWLSKIIPRDAAATAIANNSVIADRCNVVFPEENHYPKWSGTKDAESTLWELVEEGKSKIEKWTEEYQTRLEYEMRVIKKLNVIDYLVIVADILRYGELLGKIDLNDERFLSDPFNLELLKEIAEGNVGKGTGTGRGSAVGSLVCYLAGITGIDPLKYGLLFERFLNEDRVTMPDIDSDFIPEGRGWVIDYIRHKYGNEAVCCIMTLGTQAAKAAVRNAARIIGSREYNRNGKDDSVKKRYYALGSEICAIIPKEVGIKLADCEDTIRQKFENNAEALEVLDDAILIEGTYTTIGTHAAGVIIADNGDVKEYIPLMYSKDGQKVTQFDKNYCEGIGLLKMDILGLRNLSIITETLRTIERNTGEKIDIDRIPIDDADVYKEIFARGNTNSVFQFSSNGMKSLLKRFRPSAIEHLILLNAMYRPGPMQYIDEVCAVKSGEKEPKYIIPEMESVLGETYGKPIYQEQVMMIFNKFAGFSLSESDTIRRYMSKKKTEKFMAYHDRFIDGLVEHGAESDDAERLWKELVDFSKYCFNKSHACAYAFTAYYTAWLKYYYPKEYLTAILNDIEFDQVGIIIDEVRSNAIKVLPPDINESEELFTASANDNTIRYGLSNVKGVANGAKSVISERKENGEYKSIEDLIKRTGIPKDILEALIKSGACDCLTSVPNKRQWRKQTLQSIDEKKAPSDDIMVLIQEKEAIGTFLSANPSKGYKARNKLVNASNHVYKDIQIVGVITDLKIKTTRTTGDEMAIFTIEDDTGSIPACIFPSNYALCKDLLKDNAVLSVIGKIKPDSRSESEEENDLQIQVKVVSLPERALTSIILKTDKPAEYKDIIEEYKDDNGVLISVMNSKGKITPSRTKVNVTLLGDNRIAENLIASTN